MTRDFRQASENSYNMAFFELVDYVQNVETYLAKSLNFYDTRTWSRNFDNLWREANLAQSYLATITNWE